MTGIIRLRGNRFGRKVTLMRVLMEFKKVEDLVVDRISGFHVYVVSGPANIDRIFPIKRAIVSRLWQGIKTGWIPQVTISRNKAASILVRNNLIGFYPDMDVLIKIYGNSESLENNISGIERFAGTKPIKIDVPKIMRVEREPVPYSIEKLIDAVMPEFPIKLTDGEIRDLAKFHFQNARIEKVAFTDTEKESIKKIFSESGRKTDKIVQFLDRDVFNLVRGDTHGDLSAGNLIRNKKTARAVILDWERHSRGLIAVDLLKLWMQMDLVTRKMVLYIYGELQEELLRSAEGQKLDIFAEALCVGSLLHLVRFKNNNQEFMQKLEGNTVSVEKRMADLNCKLIFVAEELLMADFYRVPESSVDAV